MEEPTGNTMVIRIGIPDLQQTVRAFSVATAGECKREGRCLSPFVAAAFNLCSLLGGLVINVFCFFIFVFLFNVFVGFFLFSVWFSLFFFVISIHTL